MIKESGKLELVTSMLRTLRQVVDARLLLTNSESLDSDRLSLLPRVVNEGRLQPQPIPVRRWLGGCTRLRA